MFGLQIARIRQPVGFRGIVSAFIKLSEMLRGSSDRRRLRLADHFHHGRGPGGHHRHPLQESLQDRQAHPSAEVG